MPQTVFKKPQFKQFVFFVFLILLISLFVVISKPPSNNRLSGNYDTNIFDSFRKFENFAKTNGAQKTYGILKEKFTQNDTAAHDYAHVVGLVAVEQNGIEGLGICDTAYNYGCYHGFIEGFLLKNGIEKVSLVEEGCLNLGYVHSPSCLHGIGHGVMAEASYDLGIALKNCDRLKLQSQIYCFDGVFMERITGSMQEPAQREEILSGDIMEPCNSIDSKYKSQCWRNQVNLWIQHFSNNTKKVAGQCLLVEEKYQPICLESLGHIAVMINSTNGELIISSCTLLSGQKSDDCLIGALKELMFEGKPPEIAQSLCNQIEPKRQTECYQEFQRLLSEYEIRFSR